MQSCRRDFLKVTALTGIGLFGSKTGLSDNLDCHVDGNYILRKEIEIEPLNRFPRMIHEYFVNKVRMKDISAKKQLFEIKSKDNAEAYINDTKRRIKLCFEPWPERTPLNSHITGLLKRDTYNIEKIIFESHPNFLVTANLYIPKGRKFPLPAVLGACGHTEKGKASPVYQSFAQGLARLGYVVLIFDPIGQGERLQYLSDNLDSRVGSGVREHVCTGNQQFIVGESISTWFVWDGIRALDYLLTRPEVDHQHIGVTGNSGGGMETTWLAGVDERITMAAPSCFISTLHRNIENEVVADTEQCPWHMLELGLDHSDFIAVMAPKPVILLSQEKDFFDVRGTEEAYERLKHLYKLLGAEKNIKLFVDSGYHGYSKENREAMYGWFNKATGISTTSKEPPITTEKEEDLFCTPLGQVGKLGSRTVFSFTKELSETQRRTKNKLNTEVLKQTVKEILKIPTYEGIPDYRILRSTFNRQYPKEYVGTYAVETEQGIFSIVYRIIENELYSRPPKSKRAFLYVSHLSADKELREEPLFKEMIDSDPDLAIYACDLRGVGESQPNTTEYNFLFTYGSDYFYAIYSIMLNYPYVGQKTFDILRLISWLKSLGHDEIHLAGKGLGAIPATFAALLSDSVNQVTLKNTLTSYSDVAESEIYNCPLSIIVPGILKIFDLPDCYKALAGKNLRIIGSWEEMSDLIIKRTK